MSRKLKSLDFSTINLAALKALKVYELAHIYHLQQDPGNGCYGDAPGYPTYFTQSIYTKSGNSPVYRDGRATEVITFEDVCYVTRWYGQTDEQREKLLRRLWAPLPTMHPRTEAFIRAAYSYSRHCYQDVERPEYGKPGMLIYPRPDYKLAHPKRIMVTPGTPEAEIAALQHAIQCELERVKAENEFEELRAKRIAVPENHRGYLNVHEFYPELPPRLDLIENPGNTHEGDWWEVMAVKPTPEECPGTNGQPHPANGNWCQFCGWHGLEGEK